jgi:hypothetical protein
MIWMYLGDKLLTLIICVVAFLAWLVWAAAVNTHLGALGFELRAFITYFPALAFVASFAVRR